MIQVEEFLKTVRYSDGKTTIIEKLKEVLNDNTNDDDLLHWDVNISIAATSTTIKASETERRFIVEGFDNLYFVSHDSQAQWLSREVLFYEAARSLIDDILVSANYCGYDTSNQPCLKHMLKAAVMAMKSYNDKQPLRIPFLLGIDLGKTPIGFNYNRMPRFYDVNKDGFQTMIDTMSKTIKTRFQLNITEASLPIYTINGLLSKIDLK